MAQVLTLDATGFISSVTTGVYDSAPTGYTILPIDPTLPSGGDDMAAAIAARLNTHHGDLTPTIVSDLLTNFTEGTDVRYMQLLLDGDGHIFAFADYGQFDLDSWPAGYSIQDHTGEGSPATTIFGTTLPAIFARTHGLLTPVLSGDDLASIAETLAPSQLPDTFELNGFWDFDATEVLAATELSAEPWLVTVEASISITGDMSTACLVHLTWNGDEIDCDLTTDTQVPLAGGNWVITPMSKNICAFTHSTGGVVTLAPDVVSSTPSIKTKVTFTRVTPTGAMPTIVQQAVYKDGIHILWYGPNLTNVVPSGWSVVDLTDELYTQILNNPLVDERLGYIYNEGPPATITYLEEGIAVPAMHDYTADLVEWLDWWMPNHPVDPATQFATDLRAYLVGDMGHRLFHYIPYRPLLS